MSYTLQYHVFFRPVEERIPQFGDFARVDALRGAFHIANVVLISRTEPVYRCIHPTCQTYAPCLPCYRRWEKLHKFQEALLDDMKKIQPEIQSRQVPFAAESGRQYVEELEEDLQKDYRAVSHVDCCNRRFRKEVDSIVRYELELSFMSEEGRRDFTNQKLKAVLEDLFQIRGVLSTDDSLMEMSRLELIDVSWSEESGMPIVTVGKPQQQPRSLLVVEDVGTALLLFAHKKKSGKWPTTAVGSRVDFVMLATMLRRKWRFQHVFAISETHEAELSTFFEAYKGLLQSDDVCSKHTLVIVTHCHGMTIGDDPYYVMGQHHEPVSCFRRRIGDVVATRGNAAIRVVLASLSCHGAVVHKAQTPSRQARDIAAESLSGNLFSQAAFSPRTVARIDLNGSATVRKWCGLDSLRLMTQPAKPPKQPAKPPKQSVKPPKSPMQPRHLRRHFFTQELPNAVIVCGNPADLDEFVGLELVCPTDAERLSRSLRFRYFGFQKRALWKAVRNYFDVMDYHCGRRMLGLLKSDNLVNMGEEEEGEEEEQDESAAFLRFLEMRRFLEEEFEAETSRIKLLFNEVVSDERLKTVMNATDDTRPLGVGQCCCACHVCGSGSNLDQCPDCRVVSFCQEKKCHQGFEEHRWICPEQQRDPGMVTAQASPLDRVSPAVPVSPSGNRLCTNCDTPVASPGQDFCGHCGSPIGAGRGGGGGSRGMGGRGGGSLGMGGMGGGWSRQQQQQQALGSCGMGGGGGGVRGSLGNPLAPSSPAFMQHTEILSRRGVPAHVRIEGPVSSVGLGPGLGGSVAPGASTQPTPVSAPNAIPNDQIPGSVGSVAPGASTQPALPAQMAPIQQNLEDGGGGGAGAGGGGGGHRC